MSRRRKPVSGEDPSVTNYLSVMSTFREGDYTDVLIDSDGEFTEDDNVNLILAVRRRMVQARIIEVNSSVYAALYQGIDRWLTESLCGQKYTAPDVKYTRDEVTGEVVPILVYDRNVSSKEEVDFMVERIMHEGFHMPWPDKWPFEHTWLAYGYGIALNQTQLAMRLLPSKVQRHKYSSGVVIGTYVGRGQNEPPLSFDIVRTATTDPELLFRAGASGPLVGYTLGWHYDAGRWMSPWACLAPWVLHAISGIIQDHRTVVLESSPMGMGYRRRFKAAGKRFKWKLTPRPYYRLQMKQRLEWEGVRKQLGWSKRVEYSHRWDVGAHERVRIRRGPLPLDTKTEKWLRKPRPVSGKCYRIYKDGRPLSDEDRHRLHMRGMASFNPEEEWMAILVSSVGEYIKGPADAPYIPAKRVLDPQVVQDGLE